MHIEIDVLQNTPNGINQLKERLYKLNGRLAMARKQSKELDLEFNVIKPKLIEIKNLYGLKERENQRKDHLEFELSRHRQGIEQRIRGKKDTILAQEGVIKALSREVREHQSHFGGNKAKARE